jgi:flagellar biosynthetic protein FliR
MMVAPLWSMTAMPQRVRAAITVLLAILLLPLAPATKLPEEVMALPLPLVSELIIGLAIGLTAALLVQGVTLAGEVISLQMGLSLTPLLAPTPDVQVSGTGQLKTMLALLIYVAVDGHLVLLKGLADSLRTLPPGGALDLAGGGRAAALMTGELFGCAVRAAAPVMVALLVTNLAIAMLSRAVPQVNAMMMSFPITIAVGLLMIGVSLPMVASVTEHWMRNLPQAVDQILEPLAPAGGH